MKRYLLWLIAAFALVACPPTPQPKPPAPDAGSGGLVATGGSAPTPTAAGGSISTGGTGNVTGGSAPVPVVVFPPCNSSQEHAMRAEAAHPRKLGGKPLKPRLAAKAGAGAAVTGPSVMRYGNCTALDQLDNGSCTGDDATQTSSTPPYQRTCAQATQTAALQCYQDATNIDNGCTWNATCGACPKAFCPATNANDNGSSGDSAFAAAIHLGWFTGTRPVKQTLQGWHDALLLGPCGFDQPWYNAGFNPTQCGEVLLTGGLAGYHSTEFVGYDVPNQRMWGRNSWGPKFGVGDGYFYYSYADQQALLAAGATMICPAVP